MFCKNCGKEIDDKASVCIHCGVSTGNGGLAAGGLSEICPNCGFEGKLKTGPLLRTIDWIIGLLTLFFLGFGILYFIIILIIRSDESRREKICPKCGEKIKN